MESTFEEDLFHNHNALFGYSGLNFAFAERILKGTTD